MLLFKNNEKWVNPEYNKTEEIMASVSHGFGLALSILGFLGLIYLGVTRGDIWQLVSFIIYGLSLITLYLASTLYHGVQQPRVKRKLRVFDHIGIYLLIAGTYTPFMLVGMENRLALYYEPALDNQPPNATIVSISPSTAMPGWDVTFSGSGEDSDGSVVGYYWRSSRDGPLSTAAQFNVRGSRRATTPSS